MKVYITATTGNTVGMVINPFRRAGFKARGLARSKDKAAIMERDGNIQPVINCQKTNRQVIDQFIKLVKILRVS